MSNYPTAPGCQCDAYDYAGSYPMKRCKNQAVSIVTVQDSNSFCHARKLCQCHAAQLRQQATVEVLADEAIEATR